EEDRVAEGAAHSGGLHVMVGAADCGQLGTVDVQSALTALRGLPPPASRAMVVARRDGPAAGRTADGRIAHVVERVVRQVALADVVPHALIRPVRQRADLPDEPVLEVEADLGGLPA